MKPRSRSVCGSNFTKSLNTGERSTQKAGGGGPSLEVHSPNWEHTETCNTALSSQVLSEPHFTWKPELPGRDEHHLQSEIAGNHWLERSQPQQMLQHSADSSRNHLLASQIPPKYNTVLLWVSVPGLSYINKSPRKNKSLEATGRWTFSDSFINLWMVFKYWECEPSWACCELLRPDSLVINAEIHKTMVPFLDHNPLIWLTRCP